MDSRTIRRINREAILSVDDIPIVSKKTTKVIQIPEEEFLYESNESESGEDSPPESSEDSDYTIPSPPPLPPPNFCAKVKKDHEQRKQIFLVAIAAVAFLVSYAIGYRLKPNFLLITTQDGSEKVLSYGRLSVLSIVIAVIVYFLAVYFS